MAKIIVKDFMGSIYCSFSNPRANDLRRKIEKEIINENSIELDLTDIEILTASFLNQVIGALYFDLTPDQIKKYLSVTNACQDDLQMIKLVADNAKRFYGHKK